MNRVYLFGDTLIEVEFTIQGPVFLKIIKLNISIC